MSATGARRQQFGAGPLSRAAALVYTLLIVELLFLLTTAPGIVGLLLLDRDASNVPLAAACAVPFGPAFSAALYAVHHRRLDLTELRPAAAFWRGYRLNVLGVLAIWVPWLAWLGIVGVNLTHLSAAGVPRWWGAVLGVIAVAATLWVVNALVITSLFAFRVRDVARLAVYCLLRKPGVTLGTAGILIVAAGITVFSSEAVLALLGSVLALALVHTARPMTALIQTEFTA